MLAESNSKANSKKKKRLDKYIVSNITIPISLYHLCSVQEKKLKQEERLELFEKLSYVLCTSLLL